MLRRALIYGGLVVLLGAAWTLLMFALGFHGDNIEGGKLAGYVSFLFPIVGIALAIRAARRADPGPYSFGDGFKQGLLTTAVFAVGGAVFAYVYAALINPDVGEAMVAYTRSEMEGRGFSGRELDNAMAGAEAMSSPGAQAIVSLIGSAIVGLIVSAVAAALMRRKAAPAADGYGGASPADGYGG